MDEAIKNLLGQSGRNIAADAFATTQRQMQNIYANLPTMSDHLKAIFSSDNLIAALAQELEVWKLNTPEGRHLVITMRTPDGRIMVVGQIKASGWQGFVAEGYIEDMPCMLSGHISTLNVLCSYEETKGVKRVGFTIVADPIIEPPKESVPSSPDKATPTP